MADPQQGLLEPGNIDLYNRPQIHNPQGGISTVYSTSFGDDKGREILVPRAADGKILSEKAAEQRYYKTGEHLGIFDSPEHATAYAQQLHNDYAAGKYNKTPMAIPQTAQAQSDQGQDINVDLNAGLQKTAPPPPQGNPMISPDYADARVIPAEHQDAATQAGWEPAVKVVHPNGDARWIPTSQADAAQKAGYARSDVPAALTSKPGEQFQGLGSALWDRAKGLATGGGVIGAAKDVYQQAAEVPRLYRAYTQARQNGADITTAISAANEEAKKFNEAHDTIKNLAEEYEKNPNKALWGNIIDMALMGVAGKAAAPVAEEEAAAAAEAAAPTHVFNEATGKLEPVAAKPGIVKQILKGKDVVEPQAQAALRGGVSTATEEAGITAEQGPSLRASLKGHIDSLNQAEDAAYKAQDEAAGTDIKQLNKNLENAQYQKSLLTKTPLDIKKGARLDAAIRATQDEIDTANARLQSKDIEPNAADALHLKRMSAEEFEDKVLHNQNVVSGDMTKGQPETVNIDNLVKESQKLYDKDKYGSSRLEQFMGKDGAAKYMKDLRDLQTQGVHAMKAQQWAVRVAKVLGTTGIGYEILRGMTSNSGH